MGYFTYSKSEENLKEQYRKLLIKYDYRSGKNKKIIDEITAEYNQMVKKAKYDNGYRTKGQKVAESIGKAARDIEENNNWKRNVTSKKYTKEDLQDLLAENKMLIRKLVYSAVQKKEYRYENIQASLVGNVRPKRIYDACVKSCLDDSADTMQQIERLRMTMECATLSLSGGNKKNSEVLLSKIEDSLGEYVKSEFLKIAPKDIDPIEDLEYVRKSQIDEARNKSDVLGKKLLVVTLAIPLLIIGGIAGFMVLGELTTAGGYRDASVFIIGIIAVVMIIIAIRALIGAAKFSAEENYRQKNRSLAKEDMKKSKSKFRIARGISKAILRMFGL